MTFLQQLVDASHIFFGSDYLFAPKILTSESIKGISSCDGFDAETKLAVERNNALMLFLKFV